MTTTSHSGLPAWLATGFPVCHLGRVSVVLTPTEIDIASAGQFAAALAAALGSGPDVIVDMTATTFCGCAALTVLVQARAHGGRIRLVVDSPAVLAVLAVTGLDGVFPVYGTLAGALGDH